MSTVAFDVVDVLDGFFMLRPRSTTLHGDAPVRAAQACPPYAEGSGFGFELRYTGNGLALQAAAEPAVRMLDELTEGFDYQATLAKADGQGLLHPQWRQQLKQNWWWRDTQSTQLIHLWTGLVIKSRQGQCVRLGELSNSPHLQLNFHEQIISGQDQWTPLILSFELLDTDRSAIVGAVASVTPLSLRCDIEVQRLAQHPGYGERIINYYNQDYFDVKLNAPPTRQYAKLLRNPPLPQAWPSTAVDALLLGNSTAELDTARIDTWTDSASGQSLPSQYATVHAQTDIRLLFLGRSFDITMGPGWDAAYAATRKEWIKLFGDPGGQYLDNMTFDGSSCVHPTAGHPVLVVNIEPLLRYASRPGWSLLFEGNSQTLPWGLRGCIRSSQFHSGAFTFQWFTTPQSVIVKKGQPLGRIIPIPDDLLEATFELRALV